MAEIFARPGLLMLISAMAYAGATLTMKATADAASPILLALLVVCLVAAVATEIVVLRHLDLGVAYMAILGLETLTVLGAAWFLGDAMSARQMLGGGAVLAGTLLLAT